MTSTEAAASAQAAKREFLAARHRYFDELAYTSGDYRAEWGPNPQLAAFDREEREALRRWLAWAPDEPVPWWPGGWRLRVGTFLRDRDGTANLGVWPTREDLQRWLDTHRGPDGELPRRLNGTPEWGPLSDDLERVLWPGHRPNVVALDAEFWQQYQH